MDLVDVGSSSAVSCLFYLCARPKSKFKSTSAVLTMTTFIPGERRETLHKLESLEEKIKDDVFPEISRFILRIRTRFEWAAPASKFARHAFASSSSSSSSSSSNDDDSSSTRNDDDSSSTRNDDDSSSTSSGESYYSGNLAMTCNIAISSLQWMYETARSGYCFELGLDDNLEQYKKLGILKIIESYKNDVYGGSYGESLHDRYCEGSYDFYEKLHLKNFAKVHMDLCKVKKRLTFNNDNGEEIQEEDFEDRVNLRNEDVSVSLHIAIYNISSCC